MTQPPAPVVLVVDDQEPVRQLAAAILGQYLGAQLDEAAEGAEALARLTQRRPDLILTDLMMPGVDGAELARRLKGDPATRDIPIIAMSGGPNRAEALAAGCDDFIAKPFRPRELAELVRGWLGRGNCTTRTA
ncbi:MAG TPA: response regulator [Chloroflexota bacterium]|jgi:two-component system cell cycle response regulator DivK